MARLQRLRHSVQGLQVATATVSGSTPTFSATTTVPSTPFESPVVTFVGGGVALLVWQPEPPTSYSYSYSYDNMPAPPPPPTDEPNNARAVTWRVDDESPATQAPVFLGRDVDTRDMRSLMVAYDTVSQSIVIAAYSYVYDTHTQDDLLRGVLLRASYAFDTSSNFRADRAVGVAQHNCTANSTVAAALLDGGVDRAQRGLQPGARYNFSTQAAALVPESHADAGTVGGIALSPTELLLQRAG